MNDKVCRLLSFDLIHITFFPHSKNKYYLYNSLTLIFKIPSSANDITGSWLTSALHDTGALSSHTYITKLIRTDIEGIELYFW